jgi:hypothetical protein
MDSAGLRGDDRRREDRPRSAVAHLTVDLYLVRLIDNSFYVLVKN